MKIRNLLAYLFAGLVAGLLLIFSLGIYFFTAQYRENEFYERLRERAITTARLLYESKQQISPQTLQLINEQDSTLLLDEHITVYDGEQLIYDSDKSPQLLPIGIRRKLNFEGEVRRQIGDTEYLYKSHEEGQERLLVIASAIDKYGLSKMSFLTGILSFGWFVSVGVIIAAGWFFAGKALDPIAGVIQQVEQIDSSTLGVRRVLGGNEGDEISQLATTFNRMLDRLQQSFLVQRSFVSNASHEIRTPLTIMSGHIEVALRQPRSDEEYRQILLSLAEEVTDMSGLANELLDLAQASSDAALLRFHDVRVDELLFQTEAELLRKYPGYDVVTDFPNAPEEESYYHLNAEERLLRNAFLNLMENACKFSTEHKVYVSAFFEQTAITLSFRDKGAGIAEADLPFIFEPFFRAEHTRHLPGHGIGLPLTRRIVELHGGSLSVESVLGQGTCFILSLPRQVRSGFKRD